MTVGLVFTTARAFVLGASPDSWHASDVILTLVTGGLVQVILGSWTQLLPTIGPGTPEQHARQRAVLAFAGRSRLLAYNAALIGLILVPVLGEPAMAAFASLASAVALFSVGLFAAAVGIGLGSSLKQGRSDGRVAPRGPVDRLQRRADSC
jgi:hypothetical protein